MIKKLLLLCLIFSVAGCEEKLTSAIEASREGVALIEGEKVEEGRESLIEAKEIYEELLAAEPDRALYQNNYGWVLMHLGEHEAAEKHFTKAAENSDSITPSTAPQQNLEALAKLNSQ